MFLSAAAWAEPTIPRAWREYVRLDQSYNFNRGDFYPVPVDKRAPIPIYHFDIPLRDADTYDSNFLDAGTAKWAYVEKDGVRLARVYLYERNSPAMARLEKSYGPPQQTYWGVRLQSHNTHLVWDPKTEETAFIKMGTGDGDLWGRNVPSTIKINDLVEKVMTARPEVAGSILPERHGIVVGSSEKGQANLIRATTPTFRPPGEELELIPSHAFLNSPLVEEAAKAMGMDLLTYLKKYYAPTLAGHLAELNFKLGLYPEAHTQNTLLWWNRRTGAIHGFVHRDLTDMAIDPAVDIKQFGGQYSSNLTRLNVSRLNRHHVGFLPDHLELDWAFSSAWIHHYVHEHFWAKDRTEDSALIRSYILAYVDAAEKASGLTLDRSKIPEPEMFPDQFGGRTVYQSIYRQIMGQWFPAVDLAAAAKSKNDQAQMLEQFIAHFDRGNVALLDPAFRLTLKKYRERTAPGQGKGSPALGIPLFYRDGQLVAFDPETGRALAVAYGLDRDDRWPFETLRYKVRCFLSWRLLSRSN